jgi:hypothetical protein
MGKAVLKAGGIGALVLIGVTLINQFVINTAGALVYVMCGVSLLLYLGIGIMAAWFLDPERTAGKGAAAGALAGLISVVISSALGLTISLTRISQTGAIPGTTPEQMEQLAQLNLNPSLLIIPGAICGLLIGVGIATGGGALLAAVKPD